jgi:hypothetical protein
LTGTGETVTAATNDNMQKLTGFGSKIKTLFGGAKK